jgi:hypothetical protein
MWGSERPFRGAGFDQMLTLADSGALIRYHPNGGSGERGKRRPSMLIAKFRPCMLAGERAATWGHSKLESVLAAMILTLTGVCA